MPAWFIKRVEDDKISLGGSDGLAKKLQELMQKAPETAEHAKTVYAKKLIEARQDGWSPVEVVNRPVVEEQDDVESRTLFIPEKQDVSSNLSETRKQRYSMQPVLPTWYTSISDTSFKMKQLNKRRPQAISLLESLKACILRCETAKAGRNKHPIFEELRDIVHKADVLQVDKYIVKQSRMITPTGLPRIFGEKAKFPPDVKADAYQLYSRWYNEEFEDMLRGIITVKGKDRNGDRIDNAYRRKHPATAKAYGHNGLVLGQWWPTQLCAVRDGAHGSSQGGTSSTLPFSL